MSFNKRVLKINNYKVKQNSHLIHNSYKHINALIKRRTF